MYTKSTTFKPALLGLIYFLFIQNLFAAPVADFSISNSFPCTNQSVVFTNASSGTITTYSWNFGAGASPTTSSSSTSVNVLFSSAGDYNVTLTVSGPDGTHSATKLVKVSTVAPVLSGSVSGSSSVCLNATSLAYSITPVSSAGSYNWTVPAGGSVTSGQGTSSIVASFGTTPGNVCVTATNGCGTGNQICKSVDIAKEQVVFMNYNLLNYPAQSTITSDTSTRNPYFRTIVQYANPDILVAQEVTGQNGVDFFLNNVLNSTGNNYSAGIFINGFDTDNAIFFKTSKFTFVSNTPIETDLRDISEFKLVHILSGDTFRIYSVHLKASNTAPDEAQRAQEVDTLRKYTNALPSGSNFIVCGDFNFYRSSESAYQKLLAVTPGVDGHFIDPIVMSGTWNNVSFAPYHTQSPRVRAFGGGSTGGLNDRFDLVLFSNALMQSGGVSYVAGSTFPLGNDGNHYNDSINQLPNTAVPVNIANALHYAADHLPLICQLEFQNSSCPIADLGVSGLASPSINICTSGAQTIQVNVKNYGTSSINFAFNNLQITGQVVHPSSSVQSLSAMISSGTLNPGATMMIPLTGIVNMSASGNYLFSASTNFSGDTISTNNAMPSTTVAVYPNTSASITAGGPTSLCPGGNVALSCNQTSGVTYQWKKNGTDIVNATSVNYTANQTGNYQVQVQSSNSITTNYPAATFSNVNSYTIPNNSCTGASSTIAIAGYIGNVASSGISVKINLNHTAVGDLVVFLQSNSGEVLGLSNRTGNSSNTGDNFVNTIFSDGGSGQLPTTGAPYSSTYKPWTSVFTSCITSTKTTFAALNSGTLNPNGNWRLWVYDRASGNSGGTIVNWSISFPSYSVNSILICDPVLSAPINVTVNPIPTISFTPAVPVICSNAGTNITASGANSYLWSPASGLNLTSGATVFANPANSTIYTVTGTSSSGCVGTSTISVNLFTQPVVTFSPLNPVCVTTDPFTLTGGSPSGGNYSGPGVASGSFDPGTAGLGTHTISYLYTDGNGCSVSASQTISVTGFPVATVSPAGPITLCQSSTINLSTIAGYSYLWSNGATTQSISVSTSGSYSVVVSDNSGCSATSSDVVVSTSALGFEYQIFSESMGSVGGTTSMTTHESANGFDSDLLTMSGSGDVRNTTPSSGYAGASGAANIFITNTAGRNFIISGINTSGMTGLQMSFGIFKSTTAGTGSDLLVQYSVDGINYTTLSYALLPTGSGTATWALRTVTGLPASSNLSIQFIHTGVTSAQYRIDDVILISQDPTPGITVTGNSNLCQGSSVLLTSDIGASYVWSSGQTTQSITVNTPDNYFCAITSSNGCTALSDTISITSNPEIFNLTGGGNYCTGNSAPAILLSGSQLNVNYQLQLNAGNAGTPLSGTGSTLNFGSQPLSGNYSVVATYIPTSCTATMNGIVSVTENLLPSEFTITGNSSFCSGSPGTLLGLSGSESNCSYQLKRNGNSIGIPVSGNGNPISFGYQNIPGVYSVVSTNGITSCSLSLNSTLTVNEDISPIQYGVAGGGGICPGAGGLNITLSNSQTGVNYELFDFNGSTGINFPGTGSSISFGSFAATGNYYIIANDLSTSCLSIMSDTILISQLPVPTIFSVTGGGSFCSVPDAGVAVGLNNSETGVDYSLFNNSVYAGTTVSGTGTGLSFGNRNLAGLYTVIATKTTSGCTSTMNTFAEVVRNTASFWYADTDNDGYGNPAIYIQDCEQPSGYISNNTDCNDGNDLINPDALEVCGNSLDDNCNGFIDEDCNINLNLTIFIQGYYQGLSVMNSPLNSPVISDTIVIKLASSVFPYSIQFIDTTFISVEGEVVTEFPNSILNSQYYIVVEHRNSLQTWSASPVLFDQTSISYDFTDAANKAFGNNLCSNGDGTFSIFSGDLNKNGQINNEDLLIMENAFVDFVENYHLYDISGDNNIESYDYSLLENNAFNSILLSKP